MAQYLGSVQGHRGKATRLGSEKSGLHVTAASWEGSVEVQLYQLDGIDMARVMLAPWQGAGVSRMLYHGPVSGAPLPETQSSGGPFPIKEVARG